MAAPRDSAAYLHYFCAQDSGNEAQLAANEPNRVALYKLAGALVRAYADIASELEEAGYRAVEIATIRDEVDHFEKVRTEVRLASGDYVDLKMYEPAMRHLIDTFIQAEPSEKVSAFDDLGLVKLIVERGAPGLRALPSGLRSDPAAMGETIENNIRKLIVDRSPINPRYYDKMSELLDALIEQRRRAAISYRVYLDKVVRLARDLDAGPKAAAYPPAIDTPAKRALFDNTGRDEGLALMIDAAIRAKIQDGWRDNPIKTGRVRMALAAVLGSDKNQIDAVMDLAKTQHDY